MTIPTLCVDTRSTAKNRLVFVVRLQHYCLATVREWTPLDIKLAVHKLVQGQIRVFTEQLL